MPESEGRIVDYVDKRVDTLQRALELRLDKQDAVMDEIRQDVKGHLSAPGHQTGLEMLAAVRRDVDELERKPLATWQVISGIIFLLFSVCSLLLSAVSLVVGVVLPHLGLH